MAKKLILAVVVLTAAYFCRDCFKTPRKSPVVETQNGKLEGLIMESRDGRDYFAFLGVPFAKAPVGQLRYEPPEPASKWEGVRDASKYGATCLQVDMMFKKTMGDEDCLFLNIYTPKLKGASKLPVMVFIHGGLFQFGSGSPYRPDFFMDEDVILVTINYRLASFGFLNTGDGLIRGNMGLKDQSMAIKWTKENAKHFGGNPEDITIFGESAGGASVHFQMLSEMSKGLFQKAMSHSGLATMPWALWKHPEKQVRRFASQVSCDKGDMKEIVKCLKSLSAPALLEAHMECLDSLRPMISVFVPTLEKDIKDGKTFLTEMPKDLLAKGQFNKIPFVIGVNNAEGLLISPMVVVNETMMTLLNKNWETTLPPLILMHEEYAKPELLKGLREFYMAGEKFDMAQPMKHFQGFTDLFTDWAFGVEANKGIQIHAEHSTPSSPTFGYFYTYNGEFSLADFFISLKGEMHPILEIMIMNAKKWYTLNILGEDLDRIGACHADELSTLFSIPDFMSHVGKDSRDYSFSKDMVKLWVQFATTDFKKKKNLDFKGKTWASQDPKGDVKYMRLDNKDYGMINEPNGKRLKFWQSFKL